MASVAPKYAWMNGKVIPWEQCVLHGRSAGGFIGSNVSEGVRAYWNPQQDELFVFKHAEHLERLGRSMKTVRLDVPFSLREIGQDVYFSAARGELPAYRRWLTPVYAAVSDAAGTR